MSLVLTGSERTEAEGASVRDYVDLLKPRVMSLVVFTALVGLVVAPVGPHPVLAATALLCIAVGAGAAGALNMWYDADIDAVMRRTARRPIPQGRVSAEETLAFGTLLSAGSVLVLGVALNWLSAALLAFTILFYVALYTMWLKRRTSQNIVIGGAAGAFPPVVAWAAATGTVTLEPLLLFLVIFLWTPPHFWALALRSSEDYARAGVPMLPVVAGDGETRRQILLYSVALAVSSLLPATFGFAGGLYLGSAVVLGGLFVQRALRLRRARAIEERNRAAGQLFGFSILYLFVLFGVLAAERIVGLPLLPGLW